MKTERLTEIVKRVMEITGRGRAEVVKALLSKGGDEDAVIQQLGWGPSWSKPPPRLQKLKLMEISVGNS